MAKEFEIIIASAQKGDQIMQELASKILDFFFGLNLQKEQTFRDELMIEEKETFMTITAEPSSAVSLLD